MNDDILKQDVLAFAHLTEMPKPLSAKNDIWIEAIAKFRLMDNSIGYGIIKRNTDLSYRIHYVNGHTSPIHRLEDVYPYIRLNKDYIKKFGKDTTEKDRIKYLRSLNVPYINMTDLEAMSIEELNKEIVKAAVYQQLKSLEE